jgi:hypothetical protein
MRVLFSNANLTIGLDEQDDYLHLKWNGFAGSETFRNVANEIIRAIENTKVTRILSDNTDWKVISPNDHGWAANHWFPQAEKKGIKFLATVLSNDYFNRAAERSIESIAEVDCMQIRNFSSVDKAVEWLSIAERAKLQVAGREVAGC